MSRARHGDVLEHVSTAFCRPHTVRAGRFGRLFPGLPPLYVDPRRLIDLGRAGGPLDAGTSPPTAGLAAGQVIFGQFVDHDITLDVTSSLRARNDPADIENVRTPTLDLDCIYGDGPEAHPFLYDGARLLTGASQADPADPDDLRRHDLLRAPNGTAIIGDPRNDENRIVSQMQLGMIRFHNRVVDALEARGVAGEDLFAEARRITTWHYQWVVLHEFLPQVCGSWIVADILANGRRLYRPERDADGTPYIPVEFAVAAYRFGHAMVPRHVRVRPGGAELDLFGAGGLGRGFEPLADPAHVVDWRALLGDGPEVSRAKRLGPALVSPLLDLPFLPAELPPHLRSLATRNLLRAQSFLLPAGEQVAAAAQAAGVDEIRPYQVNLVRDRARALGLESGTPLWLYALIEAEEIGRMDVGTGGAAVFRPGEGLGPLAGRLVAEVLIGLMELDPRAFLGSNRNWTPTEDPIEGGIHDLLGILGGATASPVTPTAGATAYA